MAIGTLYVDDLAKESFLCHIQRVQLEEVIAAVLQNHAMQALLFRQVDELPDFIHIHSRRNLDSHVLTVFQRFLCYEEMVNPVGSDIYHIDVRPLAEFLVAVLAIIDVGGRHGSLLQIAVAVLGALFLMVAECHDLNTGDVSPTLYGTRSAHTQSHECHAHHVHLRSHQSQSGLLTCRHGGNIGLDGSVNHFVWPVEFPGLGLLCPSVHRQHESGCHHEQKQILSFHSF